ncbi:PX domain-containing protein [Phytophthora infestans]|uniref:PX domain-containing protein n=1 Tax=Phytophthora infestans TaxID=4787 RepID=A0A8S9U731_PHYIN|nr:PX domain-containing protein [Phytophthora infestans]
MITEEVHAASLSDKNEMAERPEADEDAHTESSEGSNRQTHWTTDTVDSEDEFEDAMEPPSSTTGVLLSFEGAAPPLSGVYEDAVEATDEHILAALTRSEGLGKRQSTIQEEGLITVNEKHNTTEEEADPGPEQEATPIEGNPDGQINDQSLRELAVDAVDVADGDAAESIAAEESAAAGELEEISEVDADATDVGAGKTDDETEVGAVVVSDQETAANIEEAEAQTIPVADEVVDGKAAKLSSFMLGEDAALEPEPGSDTMKSSNEQEISDATADAAEPTEKIKSDTSVELGLEAPEDATGEQAAHSVEEEEQHEEPPGADESTDDDGMTIASEAEGAEEEQPDAAGFTAIPEEIISDVSGEASAKREEATQPEEDASQHSVTESADQKPTSSEIKEVVAQTTEQVAPEAVDEKTEDNPFKAADNTDAVEIEIEIDGDVTPVAALAPASIAKDVNNNDNGHVVVDFMPRFGLSSGMTTTTTIEPFVLSSESNEMIEAHFPPQRWTYEVYGFSIRNRVVYYHIHRSDHRTGIRQPPILKRYTDFRELQTQLLDTRAHTAIDVPRIPRPHLGTVFRGYKSKKTIEMRESAFRALLRYISQYPELHGNTVFEQFITTSRATTGAGWM